MCRAAAAAAAAAAASAASSVHKQPSALPCARLKAGLGSDGAVRAPGARRVFVFDTREAFEGMRPGRGAWSGAVGFVSSITFCGVCVCAA